MRRAKKSPIQFTYLLSLFLFISCGEEARQEQPIGLEGSDAIIVGTLDWKSVTLLKDSSEERQNSLKVGDVKIPAIPSRCTGFLISENVLMTNQHCIPSASYAKGVTVAFKHEDGVEKEEWMEVKCDKFIGNNRTLDYALLECENSPGKELGYVELTDEAPAVSDELYIIQQNCDYYSDRSCDWSKKISRGKVESDRDPEIVHKADTLGGSSGSPVFSATTHKVIAIHHAGRGNNGLGRGVENYAVKMQKIVPHLKENFPGILGQVVSPPSPDPRPQPKPQPKPDPKPKLGPYEPNNSFATAKSVPKGRTLYAEIEDRSDVDVYKVNLYSWIQYFNVSAISRSGVNLTLEIRNSRGQVVERSARSSRSEWLSGHYWSGTYYVVVYSSGGTKGHYSLSVK